MQRLGLNQTESVVLKGNPSTVALLDAVRKATDGHTNSATEVSDGCLWLRHKRRRRWARLPWLTIITVRDLGGETILEVDSRVSPFVLASPLVGLASFLVGSSPRVATLLGLAAATTGWVLTRWRHLTVKQMVLAAAREVSRGAA